MQHDWQQSQSHDLMQDYSRAQMEYSKMLLLPYQQQHHQMPTPNTYQVPLASMHYQQLQQQQQQQQEVIQPHQMLIAKSPLTTPSQQHQHLFTRLQQHPEQLHLHPTNQSVVHKTKHSLSQHLNRCHIHPVHRQLNNSQGYQVGSRVRQLNSYLDDQQQLHLASLQQTSASIPKASCALSYAGSEPELRNQYEIPSSMGLRQRVGSVSAVLPGGASGPPLQQQTHVPCPLTLNTIGLPTGGASPQVVQQSLVRATSAPQAQPSSYYSGLSPKSSSTSDSLSPNGALSFGINLEQYISKRNERERSRVKNVNDAFDNLKCSLPLDSDKASKRISKVEILRTAISYIRNLESMLSEQPAGELPEAVANKSQDEASANIYLQNPTNAASLTTETNPTGSQIYLAYQQVEQQQQQQQHTAIAGNSNTVHTQLTSEQDYLDLMNSLDFEDVKLDY